MKDFLRDKIKDLLRSGYCFCKDIVDLKGRKRLKRNTVLRDSYRGERAFLLLTGESLQQIDISKLQEECTFGVGLIFLHDDVEKINLTFYMDAEPSKSFKPSNPSWWPKSHLGPLGNEGIEVFYRELDKRFGNRTILILPSDNHKHIEKHSIFQHKSVYYIKGKKHLRVPKKISYRTIPDLTRRSISGGGAVFFSILIMMYMGFKEIYLCGAGYTYEPLCWLHFYDNFVFPKSMGREKAEIEAKKAINSMYRTHSSSPEYHGFFEKDGFYRSICVRRKDSDSNMNKHRILNDYVRSQGVKIYNIVPDGFKSPVYEKITWQEVEGKILPTNPDNM